jgi:transcriptional regulator with XRE-family HTH domain
VKISERIRALRKENGWTQKQLGDMIGKSPQVISNWERGYTSTINHDDVANLSNIFGKTVDDIVGAEFQKFPIVDKKPQDLLKFLENAEVMFDGETYNLSDDDKAKIRAALELAFWDAKERNKRNKKHS